MSNNIFIDLTEELYDKGWTVNWEFNVNPLLKYNHCTTYTDCRTVDANVATDVDESGAWNYRLDNLEVGGAYDKNTRTYNGVFVIDASTSNTSLVSFNVDLPNLTDGSYMFYKCTGLTSFSSNLPNLTNVDSMFYGCSNLTSFFSSDLSNLTNVYRMFYGCSKLTSWTTPLPALTDGSEMFLGCSKLTSWTTPLPALTNGTYMFRGCTGLTSWTIPLPNLIYGGTMFNGCSKLTSFSVDLPNLIDGQSMFKGCSKLTSFSGALPNLTSGNNMFEGCSKLTSFSGDLSSLTNGSQMFGSTTSNCTRLDLASVQNIANTINDLTAAGKTGTIHIGMQTAIKGNGDLATALAAIRAKGWTVGEIYRS